MHELISFMVGAVVGGAAVAFFYRRTVAELRLVRQEILARVEGKKPKAGSQKSDAHA
jgi:hypothetical protein